MWYRMHEDPILINLDKVSKITCPKFQDSDGIWTYGIQFWLGQEKPEGWLDLWATREERDEAFEKIATQIRQGW